MNTDGFLEHSPGGGSLYYKGPALHKIIPVLGGSPPCILVSIFNDDDVCTDFVHVYKGKGRCESISRYCGTQSITKYIS